MALYKYCKKEHMLAMLELGAAKIGTLSSWKRTDAHGDRVGDPSEGYMALPGNLLFYDTRFIGEIINDGHAWQDPHNPDLRHFKNLGVGVADHYAFCTAGSYSESEHQSWFEAEGYDACYRIEHGLKFFAALSATPEVRCTATLTCVYPALYYDDEPGSLNEFKETFHPGLLKRKRTFADQNEVRALWKPKNQDVELSSIIVPFSSARDFVVEHRVLR